MHDEHGLTRREFTLEGALAILAGVAITISGCGGDDSPTGPSQPPSNSGDETGAISANHGHTAVITAAELSAANALTLNIQGSAPHPHTVQLTAGEVQTIANGQRVTKESSNDDSHTHSVVFN
jgi:hypothetical protein